MLPVAGANAVLLMEMVRLKGAEARTLPATATACTVAVSESIKLRGVWKMGHSSAAAWLESAIARLPEPQDGRLSGAATMPVGRPLRATDTGPVMPVQLRVTGIWIVWPGIAETVAGTPIEMVCAVENGTSKVKHITAKNDKNHQLRRMGEIVAGVRFSVSALFVRICRVPWRRLRAIFCSH